MPQAVFSYLGKKFTVSISRSLENEEKKFRKIKNDDDERKAKHLKNFRPNLENPSNKLATQELNQKEGERTEKFREVSTIYTYFFLDNR